MTGQHAIQVTHAKPSPQTTIYSKDENKVEGFVSLETCLYHISMCFQELYGSWDKVRLHMKISRAS